MGCTSSSLSFRDVYEDLQQRWGLDPKVYRVLDPNGVHGRSNAFALYASGAAQQASEELPRQGACLFECDSLLVEQRSLLVRPFVHEQGKSAPPHPYHAVLFRRLLAVVTAEHTRHSAAEEFSILRDGRFLARWDYRPWMVACCEFYHVLAVLQEQKALPKETAAFMKSLSRSSRNGAPAETLTDTAFEKAWRDGTAVRLSAAVLNAACVEQLCLQMPAAVAGARKSGAGVAARDTSGGSALSSRLVAFACEYEERVSQAHDGRDGNPLGSRAAEPASSTVPLLIFAEWAAMECALSCCGREEDFTSYGVTHARPPPVEAPRDVDARQSLCELLRRHEEVGRGLRGLEAHGHLSEAHESLLSKKQDLETEMEGLVAKWHSGRDALGADEAEELCWRVLEVEKSLPSRTVHHVLSRKAFDGVVGGGGGLVTMSDVCQYLRSYLVHHDLYCDVVAHLRQQSGAKELEDAAFLSSQLDFNAFRVAVMGALARRDVSLDSLVDGAVQDGPLSAEVLLGLLSQSFDSTAGEGTGNGARTISFDALCAKVVGNLASVPHLPQPRRAIDELRRAIGVDDVRRQRTFIASVLRDIFARAKGGFSGCSGQQAGEALEAITELPHYVTHSARVAAMTVRFASTSPQSWQSFAASEAAESGAVATWLYRLRSESLDYLRLTEDPICTEFLAHVLFCVAATQRAFEDTASDSEKAAGAGGAAYAGQLASTRPSRTTWAGQAHFIRAIGAASRELGCPVEVLVGDAQVLVAPASSAAVREVALAAHKVDPKFTLEKAFRSFLGVRGTVGDSHVCDSDGTEGQAAADKTERVRVRHIVFVVLCNYTRQRCPVYWRRHVWRDANVTEAERDGGGGDFPKWDGESALLALSNAMPLRTLAGCYRVFAQLTEHAAASREEGGDGGSGARAVFLSGFYAEYMPYFERLGLGEDHVAEVGSRALQFMDKHAGRGSVAAGELGLTRPEFSAFLQFVLGHLMAERAHASVAARRSESRVAVQNGAAEVFLSEQAFRRLIACFGRFTTSGTPEVPTFDEAHLWLRSHHVDDMDEGFISLHNVFLWYGAYRASRYALMSLHDWWRESYAHRIPFTVSTDHRRERQSAMREILREKQHREKLPEAYPVEASEDEDGYLPVEITSAVLDRRWGVGEVTMRVFDISEEPPTDGAPASEEAEATVPAAATSVPPWLEGCVRGANAVLHRTDLDSREVHRSDFRFLLQYVHHFASAYISVYYAFAILEASSGLVTAGGSVHRIPSTPAEDQARLTKLLFESLLPLLPSLAAVQAEMSTTLADVAGDMLHGVQTTGLVVSSTCWRGAHSIATFLVSRSHLISSRARQSYLDNIETKDLRETFTTPAAFLGALGSYDASAKLSYWERLRILLPYGPSLRHRQRRRELFAWMDHRQRGYLTMSDVARGLTDMVQLQSFRADFTPALVRAFRATKDVAGESQSVVYLTQYTEEQVLMPPELDAFLTYLYRYLELYFMFDVLTCGGHVHPDTLHVVQKQQQYDIEDPEDGRRGSRPAAMTPPKPKSSAVEVAAAADGAGAASVTAAAPHTRSAAVALYEASTRPYQITLEAAPMKKEVTLAQFQMARQLLRRWGAHVEKPVEVFQRVNRRHSAEGKMLFTAFAIWASEHDLRPEGYGYGYDDSVDAMAIMEEEYASQ
ncbi:hypothetical protein NESM_000323700 [Novymonas esmeraldas]|uniref:Flagellar calcium-binding protein EF-hand domain-containing protein n=1 Tax=Novymonas esmeraldas TaxID=1808958 RepID=A0AAW0EL21_9TRYP